MDRIVEKHGFTLKAGLNTLVVDKGEGSVEFSPAETKHITSLLSDAVSLGPHAAGRTHIIFAPFAIYFKNDGKDLLLRRREQTVEAGLKFGINDADRLVECVNILLQMFVDGQAHRSGPVPGARSVADVPEPPIDGKI